MKVYVDNKDKMTSYQWGYDEESKRYFVKINFDVPSDTKAKVISLADHTKQVRKEVLKELDYGALRKMRERQTDLCYKDALCEYFLDQIQGESNVKDN